jgi:uncharacterized membrane protein YbhN (UPF0104 family)
LLGHGRIVTVSRLVRALVTPVKLTVGALCAAALLRSLRSADLSHTGEVLSALGPWIALLPLPFALAEVVDTLAWRRLFVRLGHRVPMAGLYLVRVALEALTTSLPAGIVVAESVAPRLLAEEHAIPASVTLAAAGARRWMTMRAHAVYVTLGGLAAFVTFHHLPNAFVSRFGAPLVLLSALLPLGASFAVSMTLGGGSRISSLHAWLSRLPIAPLRAWLLRKKSAFSAADAALVEVSGKPGSLALPTFLLVLAWLGESVEAYLFFHLVGARLSFLEVLSCEAGLSVLKSAWFFAPAGLGATDLGYLGVLHLFGVPDASAVGAAFLVLKRGREVLWMALGYGWLGLRGQAGRLAASRQKASLSHAGIPASAGSLSSTHLPPLHS